MEKGVGSCPRPAVKAVLFFEHEAELRGGSPNGAGERRRLRPGGRGRTVAREDQRTGGRDDPAEEGGTTAEKITRASVLIER